MVNIKINTEPPTKNDRKNDQIILISDGVLENQHPDKQQLPSNLNDGVCIERPRKNTGRCWVTTLAIVFAVALMIPIVYFLLRSLGCFLDSVSPQQSDEIISEKAPSNLVVATDHHEYSDSATYLVSSPSLEIFTRDEWQALPPKQDLVPLSLPVPFVLVMDSDSEPCTTHDSCVSLVQAIQKNNTGENMWDIQYSFLIGSNGEVYEGRGWKYQGAYSLKFDPISIGIAFMGSFNPTNKPSFNQLQACRTLIQRGVDLGYVDENYGVFAEDAWFEDAEDVQIILY